MFRFLNSTFLVFLTAVLLHQTNVCLASPAAALVRRGNQAYARGEYQQAIENYEEASVVEPEADYLDFNKAAAYYRQGNYEKAKELFEKTALESKNIGLEAKSQFNLGNACFRESERQRDGDLEKSLQELRSSVQHYQQALKVKPDLAQAARNIEVARLTMKQILDEIKKRQEEEKKKQQQQKNLADKLKELLGRQQQILSETQELQRERENQGYSDPQDHRLKDLASGQKDLQQETSQLKQQIDSQQQNKADQKAEHIAEHLAKAAVQQQNAHAELTTEKLKEAEASETSAVDEMQKALEELQGQGSCNNPQQGDGSKQQSDEDKKQQQKQQGSQAKQQTNQQKQPQPGGKKADNEEERKTAAAVSNAKEILNEEKENQKRRQQAIGEGYNPVDKDW